MEQIQQPASRQLSITRNLDDLAMYASRRIVYAYHTKGFASFFADAFQGSGKSTWEMNVLFDIYRDWELVKTFYFFEKDQSTFLDRIDDLYYQFGIIPVIAMDDLGTWFIKYHWNKKGSSEIFQVWNLIRNRVGGVVASAVSQDDVVKYLRGKFTYKVKLKPNFDMTNVELPAEYKWVMADVYQTHTNPDGSEWTEHPFSDTFNFWLPKEVRDWEWDKRNEVVSLIQSIRKKEKETEARKEAIKEGKEHERMQREERVLTHQVKKTDAIEKLREIRARLVNHNK